MKFVYRFGWLFSQVERLQEADGEYARKERVERLAVEETGRFDTLVPLSGLHVQGRQE